MSLTPSFSTSQTLGYPESINFVDTSTGSDSLIASRRIYLRTAASTYLVEQGTITDYNLWAVNSVGTINPTTITLSGVLDKDYALQVTVSWRKANGDELYSVTKLIGFTFYNENFDYQLTQILAGNPLIINDNNFFPNKSKLRTCIDSGNQAIEYGSDIFNAQECYDQATNLRLQSVYYFNANS
jgi:hypothetical protein